MSEDLSSLRDFSGIARLFPLPNLVLFPLVTQGLHIFEPRYRQMTADALADDRLLALAMLKPGWEKEYEGRPALYPGICLARIVADQRLADGRYNLQVRGLARARLVDEVENAKLYRSARVEIVHDVPIEARATEKQLRQRLAEAVPAWCPADEPLASMFQKLLNKDAPLGIICDVLAFTLPIATVAKQELLEMADVEQRVRRFLHFLETSAPASPAPDADQTFPPEFSTN